MAQKFFDIEKLNDVYYGEITGNRSGFTLEDVKDKVFGDAEIIVVDFIKEATND